MMQSDDADAEVIRQAMDRSQGGIVRGIAVLSVDWPHIGKRVEQDQARLLGMGRPILDVVDAAGIQTPPFGRKK